MSANSVNPTLSPPNSPKSEHGVRPTTVWFVQGKKNNKAFRSALALYREDATLSANKENIPPEDDKAKDPGCDHGQEEGQYGVLLKHGE